MNGESSWRLRGTGRRSRKSSNLGNLRNLGNPINILMSVESKWRLKIEAQAGDQGVSLEIQ